MSFRQITDGTTFTYFVGEKNLQVEEYETGNAQNDDQSMYNGHDQDNIRSTLVEQLPSGAVAGFPPTPDTPGREFKWKFGGPHSGGWQAAFCDGSARFLSYDMNPMIHRWLGNRQDGNTIDQGQL